MKLAIIGSRTITNIDIAPYIPEGVTEIISGGAKGVDTLAEAYADKHRLSKHIIRPRYDLAAPIKRNELIVAACDMVLVFWDGKSKGTLSSINLAKKLEKEILMVTFENS
ncbi:hypothetical protein [Chakrabartyella piscis]|uniref:hypothetical protein n=1 Tax=Chakrabartyella piscis TaxID=2918914 RepID=UPI002958C944|nr:hypothetical protein [Chakrabartyella piscis]